MNSADQMTTRFNNGNWQFSCKKNRQSIGNELATDRECDKFIGKSGAGY
jgi:hypothetical protein